MTKRLLFFFACLCVFSLGHAQDEVKPRGKVSVLIDYFSNPSGVRREVCDVLRNNVIQKTVEPGRFMIIDVESDKVQTIEKLRRTRGDMALGEDTDMERLSAIGVLGAEYVISGQIVSFATSRKEKQKKDGKVKVSYESKLMYYVKLTKVKDGTVVLTKSYSKSATEDTEAESVSTVLAKSVNMTDFIKALFQIEGSILEVSKENNGKAEQVYINIGSGSGVYSKDHFTVYVMRLVAGKTVKQTIGDISVDVVEGEEVSRCKVKKGGDLILNAMRDGETLVVKSYMK